MADFPQAHTTHTTTTTTTTVTTGRVHLDISYIKTIPGILRIVEIILCIIVFICSVSACTAVGYSYGGCGWGGFVGFMGFILVIAWLLFYLFHIHEMAANVPWLLIELIFYVLWTILLFIAGITLAALSAAWAGQWYWTGVRSGAGAGSFFAFAACIVFGFHTFLIFKDWRNRSASMRGPIQGSVHP